MKRLLYAVRAWCYYVAHNEHCISWRGCLAQYDDRVRNYGGGE